MDMDRPQYANHLPDELVLEILNYIPRDASNQHVLANFCAVNRQWYDVGIATLYENPHLRGRRYLLFVRTICPSILPRIKKSQLAGLVKVLDLSTIVHQGSKSTTARLLGRTKPSLQVFIAPQASFAINCWASLSKCTRLRTLDLSLVSEAISYQSLSHTLKQLPDLQRLCLPRCSTRYDVNIYENRLVWPPRLEHLSLSGSVNGKFLWEMAKQPDTFPPTLSSMSILHCPSLDYNNIKPLLQNLAGTLTTVTLRDLPSVKQGRFNQILDWVPHLADLTIAKDYIDCDFGHRPPIFNPTHWQHAKPLERLTLLNSGIHDVDPDAVFSIPDMYDLIDCRFLGRLRELTVARSLGWESEGEGAELEALRDLLVDELDCENWEKRRWHYANLGRVDEHMTYQQWIKTSLGRKMRARLVILENR